MTVVEKMAFVVTRIRNAKTENNKYTKLFGFLSAIRDIVVNNQHQNNASHNNWCTKLNTFKINLRTLLLIRSKIFHSEQTDAY